MANYIVLHILLVLIDYTSNEIQFFRMGIPFNCTDGMLIHSVASTFSYIKYFTVRRIHKTVNIILQALFGSLGELNFTHKPYILRRVYSLKGASSAKNLIYSFFNRQDTTY